MWRELIQRLKPEATFFPGAIPAQIVEVEAALAISLPDDLRSLLTESNGVFSTYAQLNLIWSIDEIRSRNQEMRTAPHFREMYMSFDPLLFFADVGNGDLFAFRITTRRANIFVWDHEDDSRTWAAPSLKEYIEWWLTGKLHV